MKKSMLLLAAAFVSFSAAAHVINNPIGEDGRYIVKYDCATGQFAASNDMEVDETFTLAVDITGTWLEDFVKGTPLAEGATRGVAFNKWTSQGGADDGFLNGNCVRLKQIDGNIYGMTINLAQQVVNTEKLQSDVLKTDSVLYVYGQLFGFEFTADAPGAGWWMWEDQPIENTQVAGSDCFFAFPPYTGTKTSEEFYTDDFEESMFGFAEKGYAAPCVLATALETGTVAPRQSEKFIENGQLYILHNGLKYNVLGTQVQ